jgi:hypothetical protein
MNLRTVLLIATTAAVAHPVLAQTITDADVQRYQDCVVAATAPDGGPTKVVEVCLSPAKAGIAGAQYAIGASLVNRNEAGDHTAGIDWLEKAAASGNPASAFLLAGILLQEQSPAAQSRGRDYLKLAVCAGYPHALSALQQGGIKRENVDCPPVPEEDFSGEWMADLTWVKSGVPSKTPGYQLKIVIADDSPRVFAKVDTAWTEVKPGRFKLEKHKQSATVTTTDTGWDFDGEWIESWTIQLLRTSVDEAEVAYLRVVNNPHMSAAISWRAFSSFSEGTARRVKK